MATASVQDLRRIAEAVAHLRERVVQDVVLRSDCRHLRLALDDGQVLLISAIPDDTSGRPRLDIDLIRTMEEPSPGQLEVRFDGGE